MKKKLLIVLLLLLFIVCGCNSETPKETLEIFLENVLQGNLEQAQKILEPESCKVYEFDLKNNDNEIGKIIFSRITYEIIPETVKMDNNVAIPVRVSSLDTFEIMQRTLDEITMEGFRGSILTGFQQAVAKSEEFAIKNLKDSNAARKTEEVYITLSKKEGIYYVVVDEKINKILNKDIEIVMDILDKLEGGN